MSRNDSKNRFEPWKHGRKLNQHNIHTLSTQNHHYISKPNCKSFQTQQSAVFINWNHTFKKVMQSYFAIFAFCFRLALYGPLCIEWSTKLLSQTNTFWPLFLPVSLILHCFSLFTILIYDTILFFVYCCVFLCSFTLPSKWH